MKAILLSAPSQPLTLSELGNESHFPVSTFPAPPPLSLSLSELVSESSSVCPQPAPLSLSRNLVSESSSLCPLRPPPPHLSLSRNWSVKAVLSAPRPPRSSSVCPLPASLSPGMRQWKQFSVCPRPHPPPSPSLSELGNESNFPFQLFSLSSL